MNDGSQLFNWDHAKSQDDTLVQLSPIQCQMGELTIKHMSGVLAKHGMKLERVNEEYRKKGGMEYRLLQEKERSFIINVKLANHEGDCCRHFVAWDGNVIYDYPKNCKVNYNSDRTQEGSKAVFEKLFYEEEFLSHPVTSVFKLQPCLPHNG